MRRFQFFTTLRYLDISESLKEDFRLHPFIHVITNREQITNILDKKFLEAAGDIETDFLLKANNIVYFDGDNKNERFWSIYANMDGVIALGAWLMTLDLFINDSWLIKDNSMACELAFCKLTDGDSITWDSNCLSNPASLCTGETGLKTGFNITELTEWADQCIKFRLYLEDNHSGMLASFTNKEYLRVARAMQFIKAARKEPHPAIKIAHYCSAFESLFSSDSYELVHKLSERIALFLRQADYDPLTVFADIKSFYDIRSKVTHGDHLQDSQVKNLSELSRKCDSYLRSIFRLIINDANVRALFEKIKEYFDRHFKELLFAQTPTTI